MVLVVRGGIPVAGIPFVGEKYQLELFCRMFKEDVAFCGR